MPNWKDVYNEISSLGSPHDVVRRKYLNALYKQQGRNVIAYYSGWLSKNIAGSEIREEDKNGFMMAIHGLDCSKGLDLILHTPGGNIAATQSIINYLLDKFNNDIRTIVPQIAMSGGTIMALAGKEILMAKHSSIGPIDPQINGIPAAGVIREFQKAYQEIQQNPNKATVWQFILSKYTPTLLGSCEQAIQ